jgi:hypothetical protein
VAPEAAIRVDPRDDVKGRGCEELLANGIRSVGQALEQAFGPVLGHVLAGVLPVKSTGAPQCMSE